MLSKFIDCIHEFFVGGDYGNESVVLTMTCLRNCRTSLRSKENILWVSFQSRQLTDISSEKFASLMEKDFIPELEKEGWAFPVLKYNMRNQKNINEIRRKKNKSSQNLSTNLSTNLECSNSSVIGTVPVFLNIEDEQTALKYAIASIKKRSNKNIVVLKTATSTGKVEQRTDLKQFITSISTDTILTYPDETKEKGKENIKDFCEKPNHILITEIRYFAGCESPNIILFMPIPGGATDGIRNSCLRAVENLVAVENGFVHATRKQVTGLKFVEKDEILADLEYELQDDGLFDLYD